MLYVVAFVLVFYGIIFKAGWEFNRAREHWYEHHRSDYEAHIQGRPTSIIQLMTSQGRRDFDNFDNLKIVTKIDRIRYLP